MTPGIDVRTPPKTCCMEMLRMGVDVGAQSRARHAGDKGESGFDSGQIENIGTEQEASDLALNLRSGALPATIQIQSENSVGPSLGADSIHAGIVAGLAGLAAVIVVMLVVMISSPG